VDSTVGDSVAIVVGAKDGAIEGGPVRTAFPGRKVWMAPEVGTVHRQTSCLLESSTWIRMPIACRIKLGSNMEAFKL